MREKQGGKMVLVALLFILLSFGLSWAQNPPVLLVVVRASDDTLWKMTCDEVACSPFSSFPGLFRYQPTVTWDEATQEWVIVGTASDNSIWMATFNKNGTFNNDWQSLPGLTPSPAGASGSFYGVLGKLSCTSGQVAKWSGSVWECAADDVGSIVTPSSTVANLDGVSSAGTSALYSRGDHKHGIATGAITSNHILDGTIVDADISSSAAISFSKLSGVASSTHNHDAVYVNVTGDTMTGSLSLPANGLVAGTNQLVLSGGNVGIGLTSPTQKLEVSGNVRISGSGNGLAFPDGTTQTTAVVGGGGGVPAGFMILANTPTAPTGYTYTGKTIDASWTVRANMPTARGGHAAAVVNNKIYAIGGFSGGVLLATNEEYDPATDTWTTKASMPTARYGSAVGVVNNKIYAIGGCNIWPWGTSALATNEEYEPATNTWTTKASMPTARTHPAVAAVNNKIYAIGGYNGSIHVSINQEYDPNTNTWATKASMPTARYAPGWAAVNDKIYVVGGWGGSFIGTNEEYNPASNTWTTKAIMPTARSDVGTAVLNNRVYVIGGWKNNTLFSTNEEYDPATNTWTTMASMPTARCGLTAATVNNKVYAIGGTQDLTGLVGISTNEEFAPQFLYVHMKN